MRVAGLRTVIGALLLGAAAFAQVSQAQDREDTPYVATRVIWHWRGIMNQVLEDSRAFAAEGVIDDMEVFVSPGAVRVVQDKLDAERMKKVDALVERFAFEVVAASTRRDDGSRIVEEGAVGAAQKAICPVYPFCE